MRSEHERHHGSGSCGRGHRHHGPRRPHHRGHHPGGGSGCGSNQPFHFQRRFQAKEERIARLEKYLESLRMEAKAVEERLSELNEGA